MKRIIKQFLKTAITLSIKLAIKTSAGRYFLYQIQGTVMDRVRSCQHQGVDLTFTVPNDVNQYRFATFSNKEPETLDWIDNIPQEAVIWDIGANVGLYTCYAAKARACRVFAFEPSVFNLELLARNIFLNGQTDRVVIVPLPLSDSLDFNDLNMTSKEWGGAMSSFGQDYGCDGKTIERIFNFQTIGVSMEDAKELLQIPQPDYIKMDVDGIEHLILKGGRNVLSNVKGVLIEIDEDFEVQVEDTRRYLSEAGLVLKEKRQSEMFKDGPYKNIYNQIWYRPLTQ
jgi:FkbM family methyltransferase